ncbi:protein of unknown function [Legionella micdadei]|uniref:Uncharacterized protein n=1 Tax=Legionella micdadei TaxID=451 RepID=A0A098GB87_LEGMI|nr:protein of unknown function [Legionella micdadei]
MVVDEHKLLLRYTPSSVHDSIRKNILQDKRLRLGLTANPELLFPEDRQNLHFAPLANHKSHYAKRSVRHWH